MHSDHDAFIQGIEQEKRVKVTYLGTDRREKLVRRCGPLYYRGGKAPAGESDSECYYLWDFDAPEGYNFVSLAPSEILRIELTEDPFKIEKVGSLGKKAGK